MTVPVPPVSLAEASQQLGFPKGDSLQALAQRFEQVLAQTPPGTQTHAVETNAPSPLGRALDSFDRNYLEASSQLQHLNQHAGSMDPQVFSAASMQALHQLGMSQAYMQVGTGLVQSGKSTFNTLLKSV